MLEVKKMVMTGNEGLFFVYGLLFGTFIFLAMFLIIVKRGIISKKREDEMVRKLAQELERRKK